MHGKATRSRGPGRGELPGAKETIGMEATGTSTRERRFTRIQLIAAAAAAAVIVGALVSSGFALADSGTGPDTYYACARNRSGSLNSIQVNSPPTCGKKESIVS